MFESRKYPGADCRGLRPVSVAALLHVPTIAGPSSSELRPELLRHRLRARKIRDRTVPIGQSMILEISS